jgi:hypothetical protein
MRKLLLWTILAVVALAAPAQAADMSVKAPALSSAYPTCRGIYFGVNTELGAGTANGAAASPVASLNTGKIFEADGSLGINVGYIWNNCGSSSLFYGVEGTFDWSNINGQSQGFSITGPLNFEQIAFVGAPINEVTSFLPTFPNLGAIPGLQNALPSNVKAGPGQMYLAIGLRERDVSANFGLTANKAWLNAFETGIGTRWPIMDQTTGIATRAFDVRVMYEAPSASFCNNAGVISSCAGLGQGVRVKSSYLW